MSRNSIRLRSGSSSSAFHRACVVEGCSYQNGSRYLQAPVEIPFLTTKTKLTVMDVWRILRNAAADSNIKALVLEPEDVRAGWAKLEEIRLARICTSH